VAAKFGFIDNFIYIDLKKPLSKRKLKIIQKKGLLTKGIKIFKNWQTKTGKLY
jgi:hypothetical protein